MNTKNTINCVVDYEGAMGTSKILTSLAFAVVLGLTWLPLFCVWSISGVLAPFIGLYRVLFYGAFILCFATLHLLRNRLRALISDIKTLCLSCLLIAGFTVLSVAAGHAFIPSTWLLLAAVGRGMATGLMFACTLPSIARTIEASGLHVLIRALGLAALGALGITMSHQLGVLVDCVLLVAFPLFLCVIVALAHRKAQPPQLPGAQAQGALQPPQAPQPQGQPQSPQENVRLDTYHYKKNISVAMVIIGVAMGVVLQELFFVVPTVYMGIAVVLGMLVALNSVTLRLRLIKSSINCFVAVRMLCPYLLCLVMVLPFAKYHVFLLMVGMVVALWTYNILFRTGICAEVSEQLSIDPLDAYGASFLYQSLGLFLGMFLSFIFQWFGSTIHPYVILITAFLLATAMSFLLTDKRSTPSWYLRKRESDSVLRRSCDFVAKKYGLTARENDVLFLVAKGRNAQYVALELSISSSTAKTHMKRLYAKLNVHSQQELLGVVDKAAFRRENDIS
ncbi:MAG: helix-turn-helix transcriptional regulator [Coriobacteriales bacterium]|nr:helix-turn-helix transcriptional regulator [Coriobacteriales bacterium]